MHDCDKLLCSERRYGGEGGGYTSDYTGGEGGGRYSEGWSRPRDCRAGEWGGQQRGQDRYPTLTLQWEKVD